MSNTRLAASGQPIDETRSDTVRDAAQHHAPTTSPTSDVSEGSHTHSAPGQDTPSSQGGTVRRTRQAGSARQHLRGVTAAPSGPHPFWSTTLPKIANTCGVLGFLFAVVLGIAQWRGQDASNAIARQSELVTLALSCVDEEIKHTSVCQQFLARYPDGPTISRRGGNASADGPGGPPQSIRMTLEDVAVRLAWTDQFLQAQNGRFRSALGTQDRQRFAAQMEDLLEAEEFFLKNIASLRIALARNQGEDAASPESPPTTNTDSLPTSSPDSLQLMTIATIVAFVIAGVVVLSNTEFGLFLLLGFFVCVAEGLPPYK
ncbi:hypothetical protein SAMD00023353_0202430 [Rosellinia necatrix]|uniref:Uncharacterized protein n=1 Tax=Rosellinia necatrix TaxID=77044 RepID=A0A1S7UJI4_ROSNE|nr:hypothetical protein SAMD00023353_0202430 [Rosellinia necatrix]